MLQKLDITQTCRIERVLVIEDDYGIKRFFLKLGLLKIQFLDF